MLPSVSFSSSSSLDVRAVCPSSLCQLTEAQVQVLENPKGWAFCRWKKGERTLSSMRQLRCGHAAHLLRKHLEYPSLFCVPWSLQPQEQGNLTPTGLTTSWLLRCLYLAQCEPSRGATDQGSSSSGSTSS